MADVIVSWSGGKDSCLALNEIIAGGEHNVAELLTEDVSVESRRHRA